MNIDNLIESIQEGNIEEVKEILATGENINVRDAIGLSPLHYAVKSNRKDIVELLLENGADIDIEDFYKQGQTRERQIYEHAKKEGKLKHQYKWGTPLTYAVNENREMEKFLILKGADVNVVGPYTSTPPIVYEVSLKGDIELMKLLIEKGAFLDNDSQIPVIDLAVKNGYKEIVELIISKGGKVKNICVAAALGDMALVQEFVQNNTNEKDLYFALICAIKNGNTDIAEYLLSKGIKIENTTEFYNDKLIFAIEKNDIKTTGYLLSKGADVNTKDNVGKSALCIAVKEGFKEMTELLISKGADVNFADEYSRTPLHYAKVKQDKEIEDMLIAKGAKIIDEKTLLFDSISAGSNESFVKEYLAKCEDAELLENAMKRACPTGNKEIVSLLLSKGVDMYKEDPTWYPVFLAPFPFGAAVFSGKTDFAEVFLSKGADINYRNTTGMSALHLAAIFGTRDMMEFLISKGADVNAKNNYGQTPLDCAKTDRKKQILLKHGAKSGKELK